MLLFLLSSYSYFRPVQAHFDSHIAANLTRRNATTTKRHKIRAQSLFAKRKTKGETFEINDSVLLKLKPKIIQKESSIVNPTYSKKVYVITNIDKSQYPFLHELSGFHKNQIPPRRFYSFELLKVERDFGAFNSVRPEDKTTIEDFKISNQRSLKSGKVIDDPTTGHISYLILNKNGQRDWISEQTLRLMKSTFGENKLEYHPKFLTPDNKRFII